MREACVNRLREIFAWGIQYVYFLIGSLETPSEDRREVLKVLADQVLPHFK